MDPLKIAIYRRPGMFYFEPFCGSLGILPIHRLIDTASPTRIGETALAAFADCQPPGAVPWPKDWGQVEKPMLEQFEVTSWDNFMNECISVSICQENDQFTITPLRTDPTMGGFVNLTIEINRQLPTDVPSHEIGEAIRWAFGQSVIEPSPPDPEVEEY